MIIIYFCIQENYLSSCHSPPDSPVPSPNSENDKFSVRYSVTYYINRLLALSNSSIKLVNVAS